MSESAVYRWWYLSFLIGFLFFALGAFEDRLGLWIVTGLIMLGWGVAVATNWRGMAEDWPKTTRGPFSRSVDRPTVQLVHACLGLFGAGLLIVGVVNLAR